MKLEIVNANKAQAFGLPAQNMDAATALELLTLQGFDEDAARAHLSESIAAGAFRVTASTQTARAADQAPEENTA